MNFELFSDRISHLVDSFKNTSAFAREVGVSESVVRRWRDGTSEPSRKNLEAIAKASGVNIEWLVLGTGSMTGAEAPQAAQDEAESIHDEYAFIPGYNIQVSAGHGTLAGSEEVSRKLAFRRKWLKFKGLNEKDLVVVFAKGDSMEPTISDNNTIMVDTSDKSPQDGRMYVIRVDGHLVVKRTSLVPGQGVLLISDNKDYPPHLVKFDGSNPDLEVVGRVVWVGKDY
ncbi:LexA family transcriptional regulator [Parathalassolituus penaei]|uniref:Helix-turn-helix transcriptional regulator n=1 Tax=Parathalassolituus penaei TaxID=2997323 RepID=A0A9X3EEK2_9GAMM|nr:helix-turn-helix transcriptional regulator [Parathalassolituus penaei]MCY0966168.1 helix-turn-helix transcriptional regulator [Parathalassolituus penaei]